MRKTKIVCTIGPASNNEAVLEEMIKKGMNVARFNFSHGTHEYHLENIERVRAVRDRLGVPLAIMLDTKGPEIRLREFENGAVTIEKGGRFTLTTDEIVGNDKKVTVSYKELPKQLLPGTVILVDDGKISLRVDDTSDTEINCTVTEGGVLRSRKSINIPNVHIDMPYLSEQDKADLCFGVKHDVDFVAASFVRSKEDVIELRKFLDYHGGHKIRIIAKIENIEGVNNFDEILLNSNGIMIARGDMGVEVEYEKLPGIQKRFIRKCYQSGKMVITATQMLESMTEHSRPTRAEVSDVANAIFDGTTCTMLSGETAAGKYPIEAVKTMSDIAEFAEKQIDYRQCYFQNQASNAVLDIPGTISSAAVEASFSLGAKAIICMTATGRTGWLTSAFRPECPIIVCVTDEKAARQLKLAYGVTPLLAPFTDDVVKMRDQSINLALKSKAVADDDLVVIISGSIPGFRYADSMQISKI